MSELAKNAFDQLLDAIRQVVAQEVAKAVKASKDDRLLTVAEVATILNVTPEWLYHNVKKLPFTRKVGGNLRFSNNALQRWIEAQRLKSAKDGGS